MNWELTVKTGVPIMNPKQRLSSCLSKLQCPRRDELTCIDYTTGGN